MTPNLINEKFSINLILFFMIISNANANETTCIRDELQRLSCITKIFKPFGITKIVKEYDKIGEVSRMEFIGASSGDLLFCDLVLKFDSNKKWIIYKDNNLFLDNLENGKFYYFEINKKLWKMSILDIKFTLEQYGIAYDSENLMNLLIEKVNKNQ